MAQNYMYEFRVQMKSQDCANMVLKALVDHGFRAQDIITSLPEQKVFVPATKSVQEVLHIIRLTGRLLAYAGLCQKTVEVTLLRMHSYCP